MKLALLPFRSIALGLVRALPCALSCFCFGGPSGLLGAGSCCWFMWGLRSSNAAFFVDLFYHILCTFNYDLCIQNVWSPSKFLFYLVVFSFRALASLYIRVVSRFSWNDTDVSQTVS
jgi:hypothetical protein